MRVVGSGTAEFSPHKIVSNIRMSKHVFLSTYSIRDIHTAYTAKMVCHTGCVGFKRRIGKSGCRVEMTTYISPALVSIDNLVSSTCECCLLLYSSHSIWNWSPSILKFIVIATLCQFKTMTTVTVEEARRILERHREGSAPITELAEVRSSGFESVVLLCKRIA